MLSGTVYSQGSGNPGGPPPGDFIDHQDRDGDGRVSRNEFRGPSHHFKRFDKNRDGYISRDEAPTGPPKGMGNNRKQMKGNRSGGSQQGFAGSMKSKEGKGELLDVHGAGAQRSDPKVAHLTRIADMRPSQK